MLSHAALSAISCGRAHHVFLYLLLGFRRTRAARVTSILTHTLYHIHQRCRVCAFWTVKGRRNSATGGLRKFGEAVPSEYETRQDHLNQFPDGFPNRHNSKSNMLSKQVLTLFRDICLCLCTSRLDMRAHCMLSECTWNDVISTLRVRECNITTALQYTCAKPGIWNANMRLRKHLPRRHGTTAKISSCVKTVCETWSFLTVTYEDAFLEKWSYL